MIAIKLESMSNNPTPTPTHSAATHQHHPAAPKHEFVSPSCSDIPSPTGLLSETSRTKHHPQFGAKPDRTKRRTHLRAIPAMVAAGLLLASCGNSETHDTPQQSESAADATEARTTGESQKPTDKDSKNSADPTKPTDPNTDDTQPGATLPSDAPTTTFSDVSPFGSSQPHNVLPAKGSEFQVAEARVGHHRGFDRLVVELSGHGRPGWTVKETKEPFADGSGFPVSYSGKTALVVALHNIAMPDQLPDGSFDTPPLKGKTKLDSIRSVRDQGMFEGTHQYVIGVSDAHPRFKVNYLSSPPRVIIDVEHP